MSKEPLNTNHLTVPKILKMDAPLASKEEEFGLGYTTTLVSLIL